MMEGKSHCCFPSMVVIFNPWISLQGLEPVPSTVVMVTLSLDCCSAGTFNFWMTAGSNKDIEAWLSMMASPLIEEPEFGWDNTTGQVQLYEMFVFER